jgi:hypothetical protein
VRTARAEVRYNPDPTLQTPGSGSLAVSFPTVKSDRDISRLAQEVFTLPAHLAETRRRKVVVALDEFQAIGGFNGGSVEHALRAAVQHQRDVGYVFAGSEPSLMERMLGPKRPFYKAGPVMRLDKIPAAEFAAFIDARFSRSGMRPEEGLGAAIVDLAGNLPYDVQRLAHETWDEVRSKSRKRATLDDLHHALKRLLTEQHTMFEAMWQRMTVAQRSTLRAVVIEDGLRVVVGRNPCEASTERTVERASGARRVAARRCDRARGRSVCRRRFAAPRMGRPSNFLKFAFLPSWSSSALLRMAYRLQFESRAISRVLRRSRRAAPGSPSSGAREELLCSRPEFHPAPR